MKMMMALFVAVFSFVQAAAQEAPEKSHPPGTQLSAGAGYGRGYSVLEFKKMCIFFCDGPDMMEVSSSPVVTLDFNIPLVQKFQMGAALSYQSITVGYGREGHVEQIGETYHRINFGFRPMFMFPLSPKWSCYTGVRLAVTYWHVSYTSNGIALVPEEPDVAPSGQIFYGMRYRFGSFGVGGEVGVGTAPYLIQGHVFYQFVRK